MNKQDVISGLSSAERTNVMGAVRDLRSTLDEAVLTSRRYHCRPSNRLEFENVKKFEAELEDRFDVLNERVEAARRTLLSIAPEIAPDNWLTFELFPAITLKQDVKWYWIIGTEDAEHFEEDDSDVREWESIVEELKALEQRLAITPLTTAKKSKPFIRWNFQQDWMAAHGVQSFDDMTPADVQSMVADYKGEYPNDTNGHNKRAFQNARREAKRQGWGTKTD